MSLFGSYITTSGFFESASFCSIKTVLVLYFYGWLEYDKNNSTILFHLFLTLVGIFPLVGAFFGDALIGKFKMIYYFSIAYTIGCVILTVAALPSLSFESVNIQTIIPSYAGLLLIAVGAGGIKTLIFAFTNDQFKSYEGSDLLAIYLSTLSFIVFSGAMLSTGLAPFVRELNCYQERGCFSIIFGLSTILMIAATISFAIGRKKYRIRRPNGKIFKAVESYIDENLFKSIMLIYSPLIVFWALFEQQGSRWTLQATHMDGEIWGFNLKPDQMQFSYHLLVLILIPLTDFTINPFLGMLAIKKPLQKIFLGGLLAAVAFIFAAFLEMDLEVLEPLSVNSTTAQLRVYNGLHCNIILKPNIDLPENVTIPGLGMHKIKDYHVLNVLPEARWGLADIPIISWVVPAAESDESLPFDEGSKEEFLCEFLSNEEPIVLGKASSYFIRQGFADSFEAHVSRPRLGNPIVRPLINVPGSVAKISLKDAGYLVTGLAPYSTKAITVARGEAILLANKIPQTTINARSGGVYVLLGHRTVTNHDKFDFRTYITVEPNTIKMIRQLPQYICITVGEFLLSCNVIEYFSSNAPKAMQPILHASWWLMRATGNLLAVIIMKIHFFENQSSEYLFFAILMIIAMLAYLSLCFWITPTKPRGRLSLHKRKSKSRHSVHASGSKSRKNKSRESDHPSKFQESQSDLTTTDPEGSHHKKPKPSILNKLHRSLTVPTSLFSTTNSPLPWSTSIKKYHSDSEIPYQLPGLTIPTKHHRKPNNLASSSNYLPRSSSSSSSTRTTRSPSFEII